MWDQIYDTPTFVYGSEPNPFLAEVLPYLPRGKVLDIAMGEGQNAIFLAKNGFDVTGFDFSEKAIQKAQAWAQTSGVTLYCQKQNLDFYLFSPLVYDVVIMIYYKPAARFYGDIIKSLKPGGMMVVVGPLLNAVGLKVGGVELSQEDCYFPNELLRSVGGMRILRYEEETLSSVPTAKCLAEKPSDKDAVRYGLAVSTPSQDTVLQKRAEALFKKK
jgi:SAM-dependent methyltransferase